MDKDKIKLKIQECINNTKVKINNLNTKFKIIGGTIISIILISIFFISGNTTYYEKLNSLKGNFEKEMINHRKIDSLIKEWRNESEKKNGSEEIEFIMETSFQGCPYRIGNDNYDKNVKHNKKFENVKYRNFKYNKENYWTISTAYKNMNKKSKGWGNKFRICIYKSIKKDKNLEILD